MSFFRLTWIKKNKTKPKTKNKKNNKLRISITESEFPNLFISLTYILVSGSTEVKQEEESDSAAQKHKRDPFGEPGTSGVSSTGKRRKFKGDKRKIAF